MIVGRAQELRTFDSYYNGDTFRLIAVDGPEGMGKTSLVREFAADKPLVMIDGSLADTRLVLAYAIAQARRFFDGVEGHTARRSYNPLTGATSRDDPILVVDVVENPSTWEELFLYIATHVTERLVVAIDDYDLLVEKDPAFKKAFLDTIEVVVHTPVFMILTGEYVGKIDVFADGEDTSVVRSRLIRMDVGRVAFAPAHFISGARSVLQGVDRFARCGGTPRDLTRGAAAPIDREYFDVPAFASQEADAPKVTDLLAAIASAQHPCIGVTQAELAERFGVAGSQVGSILLDLKRAGVVERSRMRSYRQGRPSDEIRYRIADHSMISQLRGVDPAAELPADYKADVLRDICRMALWHEEANGVLPFEINRVVFWGHGGEDASQAEDAQAPDVSEGVGADGAAEEDPKACVAPERIDLLAVDDHYRRACGCLCWTDAEAPTEEDVRAFIADVDALPLKRRYLSVFTREPAPEELREALGDVDIIWSSPQEYVDHYAKTVLAHW